MLIALLGIFAPVLLPAQEYYIAHWVWNATDSVWEAPHKAEGLLGSLDLRSAADCGIPVTPNGYGLFVYSAPIIDVSMTDLGGDLNATAVSLNKTTLQTILNLPGAIQSSTYLGAIGEIFTVLADTGANLRVKPLMPDNRGNINLSIGGTKLLSKHIVPFKSPEWANILKTMQNDYAQIEDVETRRKVLGAWMEDFHIKDHRVFLAKGVKDEGWSYPATWLRENFNCADTTQSLTCNNPWTNVGSLDSFGIYSGQASSSGTNITKTARAEKDLSSSNMVCEVNISSFGQKSGQQQYEGAAARFSSSANTLYEADIDHETVNSMNIAVRKIVTGTVTVLDVIKQVALVSTGTVPAPVAIYTNGSNIQSFFYKVQWHNFTDTAITGNTRAGLVHRIGSANTGGDLKMDDWTAYDFKKKGWIVQ